MSAVWQYFTRFEDGTYAQCKSCKLLVSRQQGCTSNMWKHARKCSKTTLNSPLEKKKNTSSTVSDKLKKQASKLAKYFTPSSDNSLVVCKNCDEALSVPKNNLSVLSSHLKNCPKNLNKTLVKTETVAEFIPNIGSVEVFDDALELSDDPLDSSDFDGKATGHTSSDASLLLNLFSKNSKQSAAKRKRKSTSNIWQYFDKISDGNNTAKCKSCQVSVKCTDGNTSNLWSHLKRRCFKNREYELALTNDRFEQPESLSLIDQQVNGNINFDETPSKVQKQLQVVVACDTVSEPSYDKMIRNLILYFVQDLPAYNTLSGEGFNRLIQRFSPNYSLYSTSFMFQNVISSLKQKSVSTLKQFLKDSVSPISLVVDCWNDDLKHASFIGVYAFFINPDLSSTETSCITLSCRTSPFSQLNESYFIAESVNSWLKDLDSSDTNRDGEDRLAAESFLPYKTVSFIKTPITLSLESFRDFKEINLMDTMDCICAKLNECFSDSVEKSLCDSDLVPNIFKLVDSLFKFLKTDDTALSRLRTIEKGLGFAKSLFLPTCAYGTVAAGLKALQFVLELKNAFMILFETSNINDSFPILVQSDWKSLSLVTHFLVSIRKIAVENESASVSWFLPAFLNIQSVIEKFVEKNSSSDFWDMVKPFVFYFKIAVNSVVDSVTDDMQYLLSTFLDPR